MAKRERQVKWDLAGRVCFITALTGILAGLIYGFVRIVISQ